MTTIFISVVVSAFISVAWSKLFANNLVKWLDKFFDEQEQQMKSLIENFYKKEQ